jgi:hypothetical protein
VAKLGRNRERCMLQPNGACLLRICVIAAESAKSKPRVVSDAVCISLFSPSVLSAPRVLKSSDAMNLNLIDAFSRFGATPTNRVRGLSAIATNGAVVLNCSQQHFAHPSRGVLRYEDRLSREPQDSKDIALLSQHLTLARDGALPVRMVVAVSDPKRRGYHVRPDLIGKVVKFDGDHFMIDFTRPEETGRGAPQLRHRSSE